MPSCIFNCRVAVDIGQLSQTKSIIIMHRWIGKAVHVNVGVGAFGTKNFPNTRVELVVGNAAPKLRLLIHYGGFQLLDLIIKELKSHMTCYNSMPLIG